MNKRTFALRCGISLPKLESAAESVSKGAGYQSVQIPKRRGGWRTALRPTPSVDVALTALSSRQALAALLILDDLLPDRLTALARFWAAIKNRRAPADPRVTPQRQRRARLMLRVVDARVAGASYRQIAAQLFPNLKHDSATWVENPVRETTVRLARDGLAFVRGGYRKILRLPRRSR